jgi:ankyrin repeat protein
VKTIVNSRRVNINEFNGLPLSLAIRRGDINIVKFLIENGAKVTFSSILHTAVREEKYEIIDLIIKSGGDINQIGILLVPLRESTYDGNVEKRLNMLNFLLIKGSNPKALMGINTKNTVIDFALGLPTETEPQRIFKQKAINTLLAYGAKLK